MAIAYNPSIVRTGLALYLDAGNNKSHSSNRFISYGSGLVTENVGFQVNGDGTFQRVAAGTVIGGYTVKTNDVVYSYALGATGCHYHGNDVFLPAGSYATFSFDYLVTGATTYPITDFLASFEIAFSNSIGTANNLQNVWQRRSFTSGPVGANGTLRALLYPGSCGGRLADSGTIYFRNPKVEWTNVDTGSDNFSSMSNLTTWTDMSGYANNLTWTTPSPVYTSYNGTPVMNTSLTYTSLRAVKSTTYNGMRTGLGGYTAFSIFRPNQTTSNAILVSFGPANSNCNGENVHPIAIGSGGKFAGGACGGLGTWTSSSGVTPTTTRFWCVATTYDGSTERVYVDGVLDKSASMVTSTPVSAANAISLGWIRDDGASYSMDANIGVILIYNRALSVSEIQQNFNALRGRFGI